MFGNETFIVRVAKDAMASRVRVGDYAWADPDEPAAHGSLVAVRDPGHDGETATSGSSSSAKGAGSGPRDHRGPERTVDADNEADIRGVVVLVGNAVRAPPPTLRLAHPRRGQLGIDHLTATATGRGTRSEPWPRSRAAR